MADRIRSGEFAALAPLLVLCAEEPSIAIVQEEIALIDSAGLEAEMRADLLAVALRIAASRLSLDTLRPLFEEEIEHMKETGFIGEWLAESERNGVAKGEARGEARGERNIIIGIGAKRFGTPDQEVLDRLSSIDSTVDLEALSLRLLEVESWGELLAGFEAVRPTENNEHDS